MKKLLLLILITVSINLHAQMNFEDSSVQVITYWDLGEVYEYEVSLQKMKYTESDTLSTETISYEVEVSVIDSTKDSYVVRWLYKNYKTNSSDPIYQKIMMNSNNISVEIQLNELGIIESVVNWKEIRDHITTTIDSIKVQYKDAPEVDQVFEHVYKLYATKASIEATAIKDVQQFHNFCGAKYNLKEQLTLEADVPNLFIPTQPFKSNIFVELEEMDSENNQYYIRSIHEINSEQLTQVTYNYLKQMHEAAGKKMMAREDFKPLYNTTEILSRIHNTGWVLESTLWKEVTSDGITNMEVRTIQMK